MEKTRKTSKLILILLLVLIAGLSIGFAAFDRNLTIQSGAKVTPNPDGFSVVFSAEQNSSTAGTTVTDGTYAEAVTIAANSTTLSGLTATFTEPGQTATWEFYAYNAGIYDAFLNDVTLGDIEYTIDPKYGTDENKVKEAIKGIKLQVKVNETTFTSSNDTVNTHTLEEKTGEKVVVTLSYEANSAIADGNFDVTIGDIVLGYDSIDTGIPAAE